MTCSGKTDDSAFIASGSQPKANVEFSPREIRTGLENWPAVTRMLRSTADRLIQQILPTQWSTNWLKLPEHPAEPVDVLATVGRPTARVWGPLEHGLTTTLDRDLWDVASRYSENTCDTKPHSNGTPNCRPD